MGKQKLVRPKSWLRLLRVWGKREDERPPQIGVLTFEISRLMSKSISLWQGLSDQSLESLRDEALRLPGVRKLVSDDDDFLLGLALAETMDSVHLLAQAVSRLGSRSSDQILHRFDSLFSDLVQQDSDLFGLEYTRKRMNRAVKRMEKLATAGTNLYQEIDVLTQVERDLKRMQAIPEAHRQGCSLGPFQKRVAMQRHAVKLLQDASVWSRSHDFVARLLARVLFTIVRRVKRVFGFHLRDVPKTKGNQSDRLSMSGGLAHPSSSNSTDFKGIGRFASGPLIQATAWAAGKRRLMQRILTSRRKPVMSHSAVVEFWNDSPLRGEEIEGDDVFAADLLSLALFDSKRKLLNAPPSTLGSSALALHYANVIIVIEKLLASPSSIDPDVRDDLYNMLPRSIKASLKIRLRSYARNLGSSVYDPELADEWSEAMARILDWIAPLAHNMVKWHSDRSFEQRGSVSSIANVLLLQTLYFANQAKAEAAITELLVGLNYLWRFYRELNAKALRSREFGSAVAGIN